ncbi:uncharacterized protein GGS22DRAFT_191337 [Annulohypoxylon maeteangense]|uniref:uncharacterized protein n=1 Tax=Annulohypoxylon maeteangense TaxID=1927788 RepID=UPI0020072FB7|nr:uncharacterized protein GGS22DRAFT_191337 [Annulohypoxylon maeteangense]KAI0882166.1 hypothetical protein GGS22DRAFT_191337 [Annulohypoxylon maeteangense]
MNRNLRKRRLSDVDEAGPPEKVTKTSSDDFDEEIDLSVDESDLINDAGRLAQLIDPLDSDLQSIGKDSSVALNADDALESDLSAISEDVFEYLPGISREGSWSDIFLKLIEDEEYRMSIRAFADAHNPSNWVRGRSLEDIDAFHTSNETNWANHDSDITLEWKSFVEKIEELLGHDIIPGTLSKPSGPLKAILTCRWHYPSWTTKKSVWGHVADRTNPCLKVQFGKAGSNPYIRTENLYPIRVDYTPAEGRRLFADHQKGHRIEKICFEFIKWIDSHSKFLIVLGEENFRYFNSLIEVKEGCEVKKVELKCPGIPGVYKKTPFLTIIRDRRTHDIQQVAFFSYHSQSFFYGGFAHLCSAAYHDLLWNAVLELSGLEISSTNNFLRMAKASIAMTKTPKSGTQYGRLKLAFQLRAEEKSSGVLLPQELVETIFKSFYEKDHELFGQIQLDSTKSHVSRVIRVQNFKGLVARRERSMKLLRGKRPAFARVKQVAELVAKPKAESFYEDWVRSLATEFLAFASNNGRSTSWVDTHVQWWTEEYPGGLRWSGDGCKDPDTFPYEEKYHPAVNLRRSLTWEEREMLKPPEKRHPDAERIVKRLLILPCQDVIIRPRFVATSQNFHPSQQCLSQFSGPSSSPAFLNPRAFHTTAQRYKSFVRNNSKDNSKSNSKGNSPSAEPSGAADTSSRHPPANPEEPLDFADVESRVKSQKEHFEGVLKKLRSGGRFNPDIVGTLRIQPDRKDDTTYPLKEVAQVIPRGGRTISILAHEEEYVKPIMSAVQASEDFNQQPQRVPDNDLELLLKIEPESKDELVKRTKAMFTEWRDRVRAIRHKRDKQHTTWLRDRAIGPDRKRQADKELEKVIKSKMTQIDGAEKEALKSVESSR